MASTTLPWTDIILAVTSILAAGGFSLLVKWLFHKYKRPNGKKGGVISFHVAVAFATVTAIALTTKDWFLTTLTVILAYLIGRGRLDERQHYIYQVVLGVLVGVGFPFAIFYLYNKKWTGGGSSSENRKDYEDKPEKARDDRHEADKAPELRLDDDDIDDISSH